MFPEFRFAARALVRWRPGILGAAATLTLGIGAAVVLYGLVPLALDDLPGVPDTARIGRIYASNDSLKVDRAPVTFGEYEERLSRASAFAAIGAYAENDALLGSAPDPEPIVVGYGTPEFFTAMQVPPAAGRLFRTQDVDAPKPVAMVSDRLRQRLFRDGGTSGTSVVVDGVDRTIVGVMPDEFTYRFLDVSADVWIPVGPASPTKPAIVAVYGRLRSGASWKAAAAQLRTLAPNKGSWSWRAVPLRDDVRSRARVVYALALGLALLVLLAACVNVVCLLMARGLQRDRELTIRRALGATQGRVVRTLLVEHALLALGSGAMGAGLAAALLAAIETAVARVQPALAGRVASGLALLPAALAASAAACLLSGIVPACRLSKCDVAASLNGPRPGGPPRAGYGARDLIVFGEIACSVSLIVWTAMVFTMLSELHRVAFTFPADRVIAMRIAAPDAPSVEQRLEAVPGVTSVAESGAMLGGGGTVLAIAANGHTAAMSVMPVGPRFFETLGVPIIRGRAFTDTEARAPDGLAILTETAARQIAPEGDALGLRVRAGSQSPPAVVIGVCRDPVDYGGLARAGIVTGEMYVPYSRTAGQIALLARVSQDPQGMLSSIGATLQTRRGTPPIRAVVLSEDWHHHASDRDAVVFNIVAGFSLLTLLLAASGIYGVINLSVGQRMTEFGVRIALGAAPRRVLSMVLERETKLIVAGIVSGLVFAVALTRVMFAELLTLNAAAPWMWLLALAASAATAAMAVAFATRRIVGLEPSAVLRRL